MKRVNKFFALALLPLLMISCSDNEEKKDANSGAHIADDVLMGEGILDDGGKIGQSDPEKIATGVEVTGEHKIVIDPLKSEEEKGYILNGTIDTATWGDASFNIYRVRNAATNQSIVFPIDYSSVADPSNLGFMVTLINNRKYTQIAVSLDQENWIDIGYGDSNCNGVKADYSTNIDKLLDHSVSDSNLYQCYYKIGKYTKSGSKLYLKAGYTEEYPNNLPSPTGADIIGMVAWYESMEIVYSLL